MFGAVYGDIIGSYYENHCTKQDDFEFKRESTFTDDSVMIAAVCRAIVQSPQPIGKSGLKQRAYEYAVQYKQYYSYFPNAGYGQMFGSWAADRTEMKKLRSFGNGAAMRVIPIGYAYDTLDQVLLQAKASCLYSHNHRSAVRAAQAVASAVFLARRGDDKEYIRRNISDAFGYDLDFTISEIRPFYKFDSSCDYSVPPSVVAFLDSSDYESAVRNAVSLGGDADTMACIAGGIAEAYYREIPKHIQKFCDPRIDYSIKKAILELSDILQ